MPAARRATPARPSIRTALAAIGSLLACLGAASAASAAPTERLKVDFYSDPADKFGVEEVSVQYGSKKTSPQTKAEHFFQYSTQIMFKLGESSPVFQVFVEQVLGEIDRGLSKKTSLLESKHYHMKLVPARKSPRKTCSADFLSDALAQTLCTIGGEAYYAPMSVFAFLQHIVDTSSAKELDVITTRLRKRFSELSERKEAPAESDPLTPERLVMHWVKNIGQCVQAKASADPEQRKAEVLLAARVLLARYLFMDMILYDQLKDKPGCRQAYIEKVTLFLGGNTNEAEAMQVFGMPYRLWLGQNAGEILARVKKMTGEKEAHSLAYKLSAAAAAFDPRFKDKPEVILEAVGCLDADLKLVEAVIEAATSACDQATPAALKHRP